MIIELADRSKTRPAGIAEDVFVKVEKFHFLTDFVVVDYVVDPRVPLILGKPFLRTGRALIDVYGKELTLRVDDEAITFKMDFPDTFKSQLTHKTKKRLPSLALMERLPTDVCLLVYVMLLARFKEFDVIIHDKSGAENLAADHLSRLENPHQDELEKKEITETFPLETLERTIGENRASWSDKLDDTLWAFRTAYKTPIECTFFKLLYGKACHLPIKLEHKAYWALKHCNFDLKTTGDHQKVQLNELNELRDQAYENSLIYKEKTKKIHDSKIKDRVFNVGDRVFLFNSHLKIFSGKLKTRWTRPFIVAHVFPYGTVELSQTDGPNFKVNDHRLKHYFGGDIP
nr:reverse transcriptase domain-containing protein [Tanacetum cinerariifolium]